LIYFIILRFWDFGKTKQIVKLLYYYIVKKFVFRILHFCISFCAITKRVSKLEADERKKFQASFFSRKSAAGIFSEAA
jgi:hypothetical protein